MIGAARACGEADFLAHTRKAYVSSMVRTAAAAFLVHSSFTGLMSTTRSGRPRRHDARTTTGAVG